MDEDDLKKAFVAGYKASRKRGKISYELPPISRRAAERVFDQWHERNFNDD